MQQKNIKAMRETPDRKYNRRSIITHGLDDQEREWHISVALFMLQKLT